MKSSQYEVCFISRSIQILLSYSFHLNKVFHFEVIEVIYISCPYFHRTLKHVLSWRVSHQMFLFSFFCCLKCLIVTVIKSIKDQATLFPLLTYVLLCMCKRKRKQPYSKYLVRVSIERNVSKHVLCTESPLLIKVPICGKTTSSLQNTLTLPKAGEHHTHPKAGKLQTLPQIR